MTLDELQHASVPQARAERSFSVCIAPAVQPKQAVMQLDVDVDTTATKLFIVTDDAFIIHPVIA